MFDVNIFEAGDKLEVQIIGIEGFFEATVIALNKPRMPKIKISENDASDWKNRILKDGGYIVKRILTLEKCILCRTETSYTKDTNINNRLNYSEGCGQLCTECAKKID